MRLPIPDPRDALALAAGGPALVAQLAGALPRVLDLLDDAEALVQRAHRLVEDIDQTRQDADEVVKRTDETIDSAHAVIGRITGTADRADGVIDRITGTADRADGVIDRIGETIDRADALIVRTAGTVGSAEPTLARADQLIDGFAPSLERLQPALELLAKTTENDEVQALVTLVDHLPHLVERLDTDIVPMLGTLQTVAPDIHDMLDLLAELNVMLAKIPGLGRVKKRIDEEQAVEANLRAEAAADPIDRDSQGSSGRAG